MGPPRVGSVVIFCSCPCFCKTVCPLPSQRQRQGGPGRPPVRKGRSPVDARTMRRRWVGSLVGPALLGLAGCAGFWDDVTSRDFRVKNLWTREDPLAVLKDSTDGDKRARALRQLREPKQQGGSDQEQDVVVKILTTAATSEKQALCRMAAISALRRFHDPRAVEALK